MEKKYDRKRRNVICIMERKKKEMEDLAKKKGFLDEGVIKLSQEIDEMVVSYIKEIKGEA